jgi:hypothetical protein
MMHHPPNDSIDLYLYICAGVHTQVLKREGHKTTGSSMLARYTIMMIMCRRGISVVLLL